MASRQKHGSPKRPGGRSARVKAAVLQAALEELADRGYAALGFEGIARRSGVNRTTLYRRWGTLENLLLDAVLERGLERVPIPDTGSLGSDLLAYGKAIAADVQAPEIQAIVRAVVFAGDGESPLAEVRQRFWRARLELAGEIVKRAVGRGEIPPDTDPVVVVEALIAPIYFRLLMTGETLDRRFVEDVAELVAAGARRTPSASRPARAARTAKPAPR